MSLCLGLFAGAAAPHRSHPGISQAVRTIFEGAPAGRLEPAPGKALPPQVCLPSPPQRVTFFNLLPSFLAAVASVAVASVALSGVGSKLVMDALVQG